MRMLANGSMGRTSLREISNKKNLGSIVLKPMLKTFPSIQKRKIKSNTCGCSCLTQKTGSQGDFYGRNVSEDIYKNAENF